MSVAKAIKKGYKQTEVGIIPKDWDLRPIKEIARLVNGRAYKQEELLLNGKYRVLRVGNFFSNSNWYYSDIELPDDQCVFDGDLMYAWSASFGPRFWTEEKTIYHYHIWKVIVSNKVDKTLLYHLFEFDKQQILKQTQGGTMFHITKTDMEARIVPLPPTIAEQTAIATALSDMDQLIAGLEQLIAKKKAIKQGAMQELLRPKAGWVVRKLGDDVKFQVGYPFSSNYFNQKGDGVRLIKNRDLKSDDQVFYFNDVYDEAFLVNNGDVLVSMDGEFISCLWNKGRALLNQRVGRIIQRRKISTLFLFYYLQKPLKEIENRTSSTTVKHLSHLDIESLELPLPNVTEQNQIAEILFDMDSNLDVLISHLEKYKLLKQGMMQELLTGKTRLV